MFEEPKENRRLTEDEKVLLNEFVIHTTKTIIEEHRQRDQGIRREGAKMALLTCPPIAFAFVLLAWYGLSQSDYIVSALFTVGSLAFLVMLLVACVNAKREHPIQFISITFLLWLAYHYTIGRVVFQIEMFWLARKNKRGWRDYYQRYYHRDKLD